MKTIKMRWIGIRPLIMGNPQTVQLSNPYSVASREFNGAMKAARKKQDENILLELEAKQSRNDWESSAYWDGEKKEFYLPDTVIMASIKGGAQIAKKGKDVERALVMNETEAYVKTGRKFKTLDDAYADASFRLEGPCKVPPKTGALIWKTRCMMPTGWEIEFSLDYDETIIAKKSVFEACEQAGRLVGMGSWRPKFGRFTVEEI